MCDTLWPHGLQHTRPPCPSPTPRVYSNYVHHVSEAIQPSHPCHPLLLLPSVFPIIMVFSNESVLHIRWPKYWSWSFDISPSKEYSGLISFRIDWLDLLEVQEILKGLIQHQTSKASVLQCSAFFIVQSSHPYMTTGKTIALTKQTFVGKVMSLLFNMLSRLVIAFLPRSKHLLTSWLQSHDTSYTCMFHTSYTWYSIKYWFDLGNHCAVKYDTRFRHRKDWSCHIPHHLVYHWLYQMVKQHILLLLVRGWGKS